jgi:molybdopterin synthase catalytic subunit
MMITIEWCQEQITQLQKGQEQLIANLNATNGAIEVYEGIIKKLKEGESGK